MLYSKLFGKTTKTVSRDATAASHRLLLQAGFIRQLSAGRYTLLPLGLKVAKKIEQIIREEVEKTGAQELIIPTLHPIELWEIAKRDKKFGSATMKVTDRNCAEFILGPTGEVVMLDLVKQFSPSYKDLPINIYQFSQKFRDEARPTGGLLRTREFVMKDAYSFDIDEKEHQMIYQAYWQAYENIAKRLDLSTVVVESDNGAIGGAISHEFMVETDVGEDLIAKCSCGYAANLERAAFVKDKKPQDGQMKPLQEVEAVRGSTMADGVKLHGLPLWQQIKDVVFVDENNRFILTLICGDFNVNETKLKNLTGANELRHATDEEIINILHSYPGFISPVGIKEGLKEGTSLILVADDSMRQITNMYGGSNRKNIDLLNINIDRDWQPDIEGDIAQVEDGYLCAKCQKNQLHLTKAVEFGNIFNIGFAYSDPMNGNYIAKDGTPTKIYMGSYGIGIGRAMATIVETHHDTKGIIWPKSISPFHFHLIGLDLDDPNVSQAVGDIYQKLSQKFEVLFDDRLTTTPGEKFADADLLGIPIRLVVSRKSLQARGIEYKERSHPEIRILSPTDLFAQSY